MTHTVESLGLNREQEFPQWAKAIETGRALICPGVLIEAAQDRVSMRRMIRRAFPTLAGAVRYMDATELSEMVDSLNLLKGESA